MSKNPKSAEPDATPKDDEEPREFASPPCYRHEIDPAYFGEPEKDPVEKSPDSGNKTDS